MQQLAYVNGEYHPAREARVPALDAGMQFGAGLFETLLAVRGRPHLLDRHMRRLHSSCSALGLPCPIDTDRAVTIIVELLERSELSDMEARVKIIVTPGDLAQYYTHRVPTLVVTAEPYVRPPRHIPWSLMAPCETLASPITQHKSTSYLAYRQLLHRARSEGFDDAVLLDRHGHVSETTIASLLLFEEGRMIHPISPDALPGITAEAMDEAAHELGMEVVHRAVDAGELTEGAAVCVCNSLLGIASVQRVGMRRIAPLRDAALEQLRAAWRALS